MTKIVKSVGVIVFVGAVVAGATGAFFSDTETSIGNVFTAGSVSLDLQNISHVYKDGQSGDPTGFSINNPQPGTGPSFTFTDLKPLDWGTITGTLKNGANDAFVCAKVTAVSPNPAASAFGNMLSFRTGTGPGGTFNQIIGTVPAGVWFSPTPPASNLAALPMIAGSNAPVPLQYCFGKFEQNGGCVIDPLVSDYNVAQNKSLSVSLEYYAVQQRNNEGFSCLTSMNNIQTVISSPLNPSAGGWGGWSCPVGQIAVDGRVKLNGDIIGTLAEGLAIPGVTVGIATYPTYPHYTFGVGETGYVAQFADAATGVVIEVDCIVPATQN
jgi:predicted ribosomally synthesized peptide with SipW-like signal peptide